MPPPAIDPILAQQDVEVYHSDWHHRLQPDVAFLKKQNHPFGEQMQEFIPSKHCYFSHDATIIKEIKQ
jgi:hypothetical protein